MVSRASRIRKRTRQNGRWGWCYSAEQVYSQTFTSDHGLPRTDFDVQLTTGGISRNVKQGIAEALRVDAVVDALAHPETQVEARIVWGSRVAVS